MDPNTSPPPLKKALESLTVQSTPREVDEVNFEVMTNTPPSTVRIVFEEGGEPVPCKLSWGSCYIGLGDDHIDTDYAAGSALALRTPSQTLFILPVADRRYILIYPHAHGPWDDGEDFFCPFERHAKLPTTGVECSVALLDGSPLEGHTTVKEVEAGGLIVGGVMRTEKGMERNWGRVTLCEQQEPY